MMIIQALCRFVYHEMVKSGITIVNSIYDATTIVVILSQDVLKSQALISCSELKNLQAVITTQEKNQKGANILPMITHPGKQLNMMEMITNTDNNPLRIEPFDRGKNPASEHHDRTLASLLERLLHHKAVFYSKEKGLDHESISSAIKQSTAKKKKTKYKDFISYRWGNDEYVLTKTLHDLLSLSHQRSVFLDRKVFIFGDCIPIRCIKAILQASTFFCVISHGAITQLKTKQVDLMLLEWLFISYLSEIQLGKSYKVVVILYQYSVPNEIQLIPKKTLNFAIDVSTRFKLPIPTAWKEGHITLLEVIQRLSQQNNLIEYSDAVDQQKLMSSLQSLKLLNDCQGFKK